MIRTRGFIALLIILFASQFSYALDMPLGNKALGTGSLPPPSFVFGIEFDYYQGNNRNNSGKDVIGALGKVKQDVFATDFFIEWHTDLKLFGARYSFDVVLPFVSVDINEGREDILYLSGLADIYIDPLILGWSFKHADFRFTIGMNLPTGATGITKNHFSVAVQLPVTFFLTEDKALTLSLRPVYEYHLENRDNHFGEGADFLLQWGIGYKFAKVHEIGIIGYSNIQATTDFGSGQTIYKAGEQQVHSVGLQYNLFITKLNSIFQVLINQEVFARNMPQGTRIHLIFAKIF